MSVEVWKSFFDIAAVVLLFLTFLAGMGVLFTGNIINSRQSEQLRQFDLGLTKAKTDLGTQQERTAKAQKEAADAALALAKFKEPRTIPPDRQEAFIAALKPFAGQKFALAVFPDPEPLALIRTLDVLLKSSGWQRVPAQIQREGGVLLEVAGDSAASIFDSGVDAYVAPDDTESLHAQIAFCQALIDAGISCERHQTPQLTGKTPRAITISVGKKP